MLIGYAPISTDDQNLDLQSDALKTTGCDKISGAKADRLGLITALKVIRTGDTLVIWRLDRLVRSLKDLIDLMEVGNPALLGAEVHGAGDLQDDAAF